MTRCLAALAVLVTSLASAEAPVVRVLTGPSARVTVVAYSPNGKILASGGGDSAVRLYDADSGSVQHLLGVGGAVTALTWTPDGQAVVIAASGAPLQAWSSDGNPLWSTKLPGHLEIVSLAAAHDGRVIAGATDGTLHWYDLHTGKAGRTLKAAKGPLVALAISYDDLFLVTTDGGAVPVYNGKTGKLTYALPADKHETRTALCISPDGRVLALAANDGEVKFFTLLNGKSVGGYTGSEGASIRSISYAATGDRVLTSASDGAVRLWDIVNGVRLSEFVGHTGAVSTSAMSPDVKEVATGGDDATVRIWNAEIGSMRLKLLGPRGPVTAVSWIPRLEAVASASSDGAIRAWDAKTGLLKWQKNAHDDVVTGFAGSIDGRYLITAGGTSSGAALDPPQAGVQQSVDSATPDRGTIKIWNAQTGEFVRQLYGHAKEFGGLALSPDGRVLVTAADKDLIVWDMASASGRFRLPGHTANVRAVAISSDASTVASGSDDGTVRLWDARSSAPKGLIEIGRPVDAVALSMDGTLLASATTDSAGAGIIQLWDAPTGKEIRTLKEHPTPISALRFSNDGWFLASTSRSVGRAGDVKKAGEACLWLTQSGRLVGTLHATATDMRGFESIAFAPDAQSLALGCDDWTVRIWNPPPVH